MYSERVEYDIVTMERDYKQKHAQKQEQVQLLLKELEQCYNDNSALKLSKKQTTKGTHIYMIVYKLTIATQPIPTEYEEAESQRCQQSGSLGDLKNRCGY